MAEETARQEPLRILLLEDMEIDAELIGIELRKSGKDMSLTRVDTREEFITRLRAALPDIILSDYSLPTFGGPEALRHVQSLCPDVPFIFVSGAIGEDVAIEMMKSGATDYVLKQRLSRLVPAVERALREVRERRDRERISRELRASHGQLRALAAHLQSVREEERTRISRELHDVLGQALTAMKMDVAWLQKKLGPENTPLIERTNGMSDLINQTIQSMRKIATELRPGILDDLGLGAALDWQAQEFQNRSGIRCTLMVSPEEIPAGREHATAIFRIFQETLTNILRHANATSVEVALTGKEGTIRLEVHDNGRGMPAPTGTPPRSLGILGMRERAQALGGTVNIESSPGAGTTVRVTVPSAVQPVSHQV